MLTDGGAVNYVQIEWNLAEINTTGQSDITGWGKINKILLTFSTINVQATQIMNRVYNGLKL